MTIEEKSVRGHSSQVGSALGNLEDPVAIPTVEMMVVRLARQFIPVWFAGKADEHQPLLADHHLEIAVDGCYPQAGGEVLRRLEDLLGTQRSIGIGEHPLDSISLLGFSGHIAS